MIMNTMYIIGIVGVLLIAALLFPKLKGNAIQKAIVHARKEHDVKPFIAAVDEDSTADVPTIYNSAIKSLWDSYDRETATDLIKALLERNDTAPISQFWIKTLLEVEPEIARKQLGEVFIQEHYNEGIAAQCGGCGGSCKKCKSCK
jgi:hypothetical protein